MRHCEYNQPAQDGRGAARTAGSTVRRHIGWETEGRHRVPVEATIIFVRLARVRDAIRVRPALRSPYVYESVDATRRLVSRPYNL